MESLQIWGPKPDFKFERRGRVREKRQVCEHIPASLCPASCAAIGPGSGAHGLLAKSLTHELGTDVDFH